MKEKIQIIEDFAKKHKCKIKISRYIFKSPVTLLFWKVYYPYSYLKQTKAAILLDLYHELYHYRNRFNPIKFNDELSALKFSFKKMRNKGYNYLMNLELNKRMKVKYGLTIKEIKEEIILEEVLK